MRYFFMLNFSRVQSLLFMSFHPVTCQRLYLLFHWHLFIFRHFLFPPYYRFIATSRNLYIYIYLYNWYIFIYVYIYIISSVMHAFWLVLTYDLLEDRRIYDVIIKTVFPYFLILTTFWRHLWSITEQTHGNLESIC